MGGVLRLGMIRCPGALQKIRGIAGGGIGGYLFARDPHPYPPFTRMGDSDDGNE